MSRLLLLALFTLTTGIASFGQVVVSFPYFENFESNSWTVSNYPYGKGHIHPEWTRIDTIDYYWKPFKGSDQYGTSGPKYDHTLKSGKYLCTGGSSTDTSAYISSPWINLDSAISPALRFADYRYGNSIQKLVVWAQRWNSSSLDTLYIATGQNRYNSTSSWAENSADLSSYAGDTIRLVFEAFGTQENTRTIAIDDIVVAENDTCQLPTSFYRSSNSINSITVRWTKTYTDSTYLRILKDGDPLSNAQIFAIGDTNAYTFTGLATGTYYHIWATSECAKNNGQQWTNQLIERTWCGSVSSPFIENFEGVAWSDSSSAYPTGTMDPCWSNTGSPTKIWQVTTPTTSVRRRIPPPPNGSTQWIQYGGHDMAPNSNTFLISPQIQFNSANQYLSFWYNAGGKDVYQLRVYYRVPGTSSYTTLVTIPVNNQPIGGLWKRKVISLSAIYNLNVQLMIRADHYASSNSNEVMIALDDIQITSTAPCGVDIDLIPFSKTHESISFTTNVSYPLNIQYGPRGFELGTGTTMNVTGPRFTINGLSAQTEYDIYVRHICGGVSTWIGPLITETDCPPVSIPYRIDFESPDFVIPTSYQPSQNEEMFPDCWNPDNSESRFYWVMSNYAHRNGSPNDHTTGVGRYASAYMEYGTKGPGHASLKMPLVDLVNSTNPELSFWYKFTGDDALQAFVRVHTSSASANVKTFYVDLEGSPFGEWNRGIIDLSPYVGQVIRLEFKATADSTGSGTISYQNVLFNLDDIEIKEMSSCPEVLNFHNTNTSKTSLTFAWDGRAQSSWEIEYGELGFQRGSGQTVTVTGSPSTTIVGLLPGTHYQFYITPSCANANEVVAGEATAITYCGATAAPLLVDFENEIWRGNTYYFTSQRIAPCWSSSTTGTIGTNNRQSIPTGYFSGDHTTGSGKYWASRRMYSTGSMDLRTSRIDVSQLDSAELRFWYYQFSSSIADTVRVEVYSELTGQTIRLGRLQPTATSPFINMWSEAIFDLSDFQGDTIQIKWQTYNPYYNKFGIDDISIDEKASCSKPLNVTASTFQQNAVKLEWSTGSESNWTVLYGPVNAAQNQFDTLHTIGSPLLIENLIPNTEYVFRVRSQCYPTGQSEWSQPAYAYSRDTGCIYSLTLSKYNLYNLVEHVRVYIDGNPTNGQDYFWTSDSTVTYDVYIPENTGYDLQFNGYVSNYSLPYYAIEFRDPSGAIVFSRVYQNLTQAGPLDGTTLFSGSSQSCRDNCSGIISPTINGVHYTSANLSWVSNADSSEVWIGASGSSTPTSGNFNSSPLLFDTLSHNTSYSVYIRDTCDGTSWLGPFNFTTLDCSTPDASFSYNNTWTQFEFYSAVAADPGISRFHWDFGDGTTSTQSNPKHSYVRSGSYDVWLMVYDWCGGGDTVIQTIYVCDSLSAGISSQMGTGSTVQFNSTSSIGAIAHYSWGFGDGITSVQASPSHTYSSMGIYTASLVVTDSCGNTATTSHTVEACQLPQISYSTTANGLRYTFNATSSLYTNQYNWKINGTQYNSAIAVHTFPSYGRYKVTLQNTNPCNAKVDSIFYVEICVNPQARMSSRTLSQSLSHLEVEFSAVQSIGDTYHWDFGDGSTADTIIARHTFTSPFATYQVELQVSNICGEVDTSVIALTWIGTPEWGSDEISLYPNPSKGDVTIQLPASISTNVQLSVLAIDGRILERDAEYVELQNNRILLQVQQPPGNYILKIQSEQIDTSLPLIIQD